MLLLRLYALLSNKRYETNMCSYLAHTLLPNLPAIKTYIFILPNKRMLKTPDQFSPKGNCRGFGTGTGLGILEILFSTRLCRHVHRCS
jgi:hypothetical protein